MQIAGATMRFSLRSLILSVLIAGLICGWTVDRYRLQRNLEIERNRGFVSAEDYYTRLKDIRTLANAEAPDFPLLLFALSDPDFGIRETALAALQKVPMTQYFGPDEKEVTSELERWLLRKEKDP